MRAAPTKGPRFFCDAFRHRVTPRHKIDLLYMLSTCSYRNNMSRMIQVRNVPDALHRLLKARAAMSGMSLSDYLLAELREISERPTLGEMAERLQKRRPVKLRVSSAALVRAERASR